MTARINSRQDSLIAAKYEEMRASVFVYVAKRIGDEAEAEDIVQDVFVKLLEYEGILAEHSLPNFIFRIAYRLVVDWYRRHALCDRAREFFASCTRQAADTVSEAVDFRRMQAVEKACIDRMGEKKSRVYLLYIHAGRSAAEIADALSLSRRTVENHIFAARNMVREEFAKAL